MINSLPLLQIALDNQSLSDALKTTRLIANTIDIIEVGTILCLAEGIKAITALQTLYPDKIILADAKIADAGKILSKMCFEAGANWITVGCCADINTAAAALEIAKNYSGDIQIELTGFWNWSQAEAWQQAGIKQVVYHRSRDAQAAGVNWNHQDLTTIQRLINMGFKITVTGGLTQHDLTFFKNIPIYAFIAGRSIRDATDPAAAAKSFKQQIQQLWG